MTNQIDKTVALAKAIVEYYNANRQAGHSFAICSTKSNRQPRFLMTTHKGGFHWFKQNNIKVSDDDIVSPADMQAICKLHDNRPLVIDHYITTMTLQSLLDIVDEQTKTISKCKEQLHAKDVTISCLNTKIAQCTTSTSSMTSILEYLQHCSFIRRIAYVLRPASFIDKVVTVWSNGKKSQKHSN